MDPTLQSTIRQLINLARLRGVNPAHPVQITLTENDTAEARNFIVVCSYTEPTFSEVPYNCLWINVNMGSPDFGLLRRRTSHVTDGAFRGTWEEIVDMPHLYSVSQVYRFVVENPADLGMDISDTTLPHATTRVMGVVTLQSDHPDTEAVSSSDPRMTDARYPNAHDHPDYPRSKIKINATQYALVEGNKPDANSVLLIHAPHPTNRDVFLARWDHLKVEDVEWSSPRLERLVISLPGNASFMNDDSEMDLIGTAVWSNRTEVDPTGLEWSIAANNVGVTIDPVTGVVTAPKLQFDTDLKVTVRLFDVVFNKWATAEYTLRIIVKAVVVVLTSIEIVGPTEMFPADQATFGVVGHYSDGTSAAIAPDTFAGNNNQALALSQYVGVAGRVNSDTVVTLSAVKDGLTDTHDVLIHKLVPVTLTITGPATINEHTSAGYLFTVAYNDGTQQQTTVNTFTVDNAKATITGSNVAAGEVVVDEAAVLTATKTVNGVTVTATKNITLRNVSNPPVKYPESLLVGGAGEVQELTSSQYTAQVVYSDGSTAPLSQADVTGWSTVVGTINSTGMFTAPDVITDTPSTVTVRATVAGYALTGSKNIMIRNVEVVVPDHITITGPTSINEGSVTTYQADLYYSDGSVRAVSSSEMTSWEVTGGSTISTKGTLTAKQVNADETATITLSATCDGVALTDTHVVTLRNLSVGPASLAIIGPTDANEGTTSNYAGQITLTNGSKVTPDTITSWTIKSGSGSIDASGKATWPNAVSTYTSVIELKASHMGQAFTATLNVTVASLNNVVGFELVGPTSILEGQTGTYYMNAIHENGARASYSSRTVLKFVSATSAASINGIIVTANQVSADTVVRLEGSTTADGKEWFATLDVTIKDIPVTPSSIAIAGPSPVTESTSNSTYTCTATMSNSSTKTVNPTWSITNNGGITSGLSISAAGVLTVPDVAANTTIVIQASYTEGGLTRTATKSVAITNVPVVDPGNQPKVKFGIINRITSAAGYNAAFLASLTTELPGVVEDTFDMPAGSSTSGNGKWGYVALPKATHGYAYIVETVTNFAGSWDGATQFTDFDEWNGPWEGVIGGVPYVVYRHDFPFENALYRFKIRYNSSNPMSGQP